jgi:RNA polymerase sigma-70 factor (ECF subfamily)
LQCQPTDQAAWDAFVERYGPQIYGWCRQWHLQDADARDVTQAVLARLAARMRTFTYDPSKSFRAWLKTLTHHAWRDYVEDQQRAGVGSGDSRVQELLHHLEARADLVRQLEEAFDHELLEAAIARVRLRVAPRTWEVYRLAALEGRPGAEVAKLFQMKVARVFVVKSKVHKLLQEEIRRLEAGGPEARGNPP